MKRKGIIVVTLAALLLCLCATPAFALETPQLPHAFYGSVEINDNPAPIGTVIEVRGEGVAVGAEGNPVVITETGYYGSPQPLKAKLVVQGDIEDGTELTFYVNGKATGQTCEWHSQGISEFDLSITVSEGSSSGGGLGATSTDTTFDVSFFGESDTFIIDEDTGIIGNTIVASSSDGKMTVSIEKGTKALQKNGNPIANLSMTQASTVPWTPDNCHCCGSAYLLEPAGATFDPPLALSVTYADEDIPDGVNAEDLYWAYFDESEQQWVKLESTVDLENKTVTAQVSHFTCFAVMGCEIEEETAPESGDSAEPEVTTTAPATPEEQSGDSSASSTTTETSSLTQTAAQAAGLDEEGGDIASEQNAAEEGTNWSLIGGIIAAVIVLGIVIFLFVNRRTAKANS